MASNMGYAQFSYGGPSAITYSPDNKLYYVVNQITKDVIEVNTFGQGRIFITGLNSPNNITYANLPIGAGFLILDSNEVKLYDTTGFYIGSEVVSGAQRLQDLVFDKQAEIIYATDVKRGVIYKTTFGAPPLYIPSTTIFASGLRNPAGLYLDKINNRLLYTEMVDSSYIKTVSLSNASVGTLKFTGLDSVIAIERDLQGNYYLASVGNMALYSWNKYLSGSPVKQFFEPRPGDFYMNHYTDVWAYTCYACGKWYSIPLHRIGPMFEDMQCAGDSAITYASTRNRVIGTYSQGNKFIVELSDINFSFGTGKTTKLAEVTDTLVPKTVAFKTPNLPAGMYRMRWRSTNPAADGILEQFHIKPIVDAQAYGQDTASLCSGNSIKLGANNDTNATYSWSPAIMFNNASVASPNFIGTASTWVYMISSATDYCTVYDSVFVNIITKPSIFNLLDTVSACEGETLKLGKENADLTFAWSPTEGLSNPNVAHPTYSGSGMQKYTCTITAQGGCSSKFEQVAVLNRRPKLLLTNNEIYFCPNNNSTASAGLFVDSVPYDSSRYFLSWVNEKGEITENNGLEISLMNKGLTHLKVMNAQGCLDSIMLNVYTYDSLQIGLTVLESDSLIVSVVGNPAAAKYTWFKNGVKLNAPSKHTYRAKDTGLYYVQVQSGDSCIFRSEVLQVKPKNTAKLKTPGLQGFYIAQDSYGIQLLSREKSKERLSIYIMNMNGYSMNAIENATLPISLNQFSSKGLNIASIYIGNECVQVIKFMRIE
jgi:hypothetical protein